MARRCRGREIGAQGRVWGHTGVGAVECGRRDRRREIEAGEGPRDRMEGKSVRCEHRVRKRKIKAEGERSEPRGAMGSYRGQGCRVRALIEGRSEPEGSIAVEWQGRCCDGLGNERERMKKKRKTGRKKVGTRFRSGLVWTSFGPIQAESKGCPSSARKLNGF